MQPLISKVAPILWRTSAAAGATKHHCSSAPESSKSRNHLAAFDSNLFSCRFVSDGGADVIPNLLCASAVTHPPPPSPALFSILLVLISHSDPFPGVEWGKPSLLCVWRLDGKVENASLCTQSLPSRLFFYTTCCIFIFFSSSFATACPTWKCTYSTLPVPVQTQNLLFSGFFFHIQLPDWAANTAPRDYFVSHWSRARAHTRSWHISPQTFQNTLCHFLFLFSDKVKRQVSGPMPPTVFSV